MRPRGEVKDLALAILFGVLYAIPLALDFSVLEEHLSGPQRFAVAVAALPLLWVAAGYFAAYWRGRRNRSGSRGG